jgi:hypothetical protein
MLVQALALLICWLLHGWLVFPLTMALGTIS